MLDSSDIQKKCLLCLCVVLKGVIYILGKSQIYEIVDYIKILYPHTKKLVKNHTTFEVWSEMLGDNSMEDIKKAIVSFSKKENYPPTPQAILKELSSQFKVETKTTQSGVYIIFVRYNDELIQFKYTDIDEANNLIAFLKSYPDREDIRNQSEELLRKQTLHIRGEIYYSPDILAGIEEHRRKSWMDMKISEHKKYNQRRDKQ